MKLKDYLSDQRGEASRLATDLKISPVLISQWANEVRPIPIDKCVPIERATDGKVSRKDLRPSDWHEIWPELVEAA